MINASNSSGRSAYSAVGSTPPTTIPLSLIGENSSDSRATCTPRTLQVAILSLHDMLIEGTESARPGLVRMAEKLAYPLRPLTVPAPMVMPSGRSSGADRSGAGLGPSLRAAMSGGWCIAVCSVEASPH